MDELKLGMRVYSTLHDKYMVVECVRFLKDGIVWLMHFNKTYPHTLKYIDLEQIGLTKKSK